MPDSSPKPKVFRLPPAAPSKSLKPQQLPSIGYLWRLGAALLVLGVLWPAATVFFAHDVSKTSAEPTLEGILPPVSDAQAAAPGEKLPTILLRGQSEAIIGQMARIPVENEPIIEMQAVSTVDNNAARELLSIISKY